MLHTSRTYQLNSHLTGFLHKTSSQRIDSNLLPDLWQINALLKASFHFPSDSFRPFVLEKMNAVCQSSRCFWPLFQEIPAALCAIFAKRVKAKLDSLPVPLLLAELYPTTDC